MQKLPENISQLAKILGHQAQATALPQNTKIPNNLWVHVCLFTKGNILLRYIFYVIFVNGQKLVLKTLDQKHIK